MKHDLHITDQDGPWVTWECKRCGGINAVAEDRTPESVFFLNDHRSIRYKDCDEALAAGIMHE